MPASPDSPLLPPVGHNSWLEYALATFDVRSVVNDRAIGERPIHREDILAAAWAELNDLRAQAGLQPLDPQGKASEA